MEDKLDDIAFSVYGGTVNKALPELLPYPQVKQSLEHDYPDQDGKDVDMSDPKYSARQFRIKITIRSNSLADFKTKYYGLWAALKAPGMREFYSAGFEQTYYLRYLKQENFKLLSTGLNNPNGGVEFDLLFDELDPADNIDNIYLVDEGDNFIIG